jgi:asparagine synthase (glutamine-hydrolysing)
MMRITAKCAEYEALRIIEAQTRRPMCGIAGLYHPKGVSQELVKRMTDAISHRGPDAEGFHVEGNFGLGHRRLSIIDLSTSANQPMASACGRYWIVFNGEVYNFQEVAKELAMQFRTSGDTEVIVEAFAKWGPRMVEKLNGMFAMAILDSHTNKLYLFRDRLGIKPLFVYQKNGMLAFASELKAITALGSVAPLSINRKAIPYFLHLGYIPQPITIYNEVSKFPSGFWAEFDGEHLKTECFWNPEEKISTHVLSDEIEAKAQLETLLTASVKRRLIADVPFGTFLSGGVDSSLVTALAQKCTSDTLKTFSIGFEDKRHNESGFARQVAQYLGTDHHEYTVTEKDALELITQIVPQYDEPYADSSAIPTMLVSKMARQEVTMTLSGDGGDELFMGYGAYDWAERLDHPLVSAMRSPLATALSLGNDRYKRISKLFRYGSADHLQAHIFSQEQYLFGWHEVDRYLLNAPCTKPVFSDLPEQFARQLTASEQQAFFDLRYYLKDDLLTKVDRATMRYSLETRVPILDHTVVEFALNLDPALKKKNGVAKYLLKQVLYDHVPKSIMDRPKWGFSIPLSRWLGSELRFLIEEFLSESKLKETRLFNPEQVKGVVRNFLSGQTHLYNRVWLLILVQQWFLLYARNCQE